MKVKQIICDAWIHCVNKRRMKSISYVISKGHERSWKINDDNFKPQSTSHGLPQNLEWEVQFPLNGSSEFKTIFSINGEQFGYSTDTSTPSCRPEVRARSTNENSTSTRVYRHFDRIPPLWQCICKYLKKMARQNWEKLCTETADKIVYAMPLDRHHAALIYTHWHCGKYEQLRPVFY